MSASATGTNHGAQLTLFNERFNVRCPNGDVARCVLEGEDDFRRVPTEDFALRSSGEELNTALVHVEQRGTRGPPRPFFALSRRLP